MNKELATIELLYSIGLMIWAVSILARTLSREDDVRLNKEKLALSIAYLLDSLLLHLIGYPTAWISLICSGIWFFNYYLCRKK